MNNQHSQPKVALRALEPEDLDLLYQIENDCDLWLVGTTNVPYSRYVLHDYLARSTGDIYTDKQVRLVIENAEGTTVGLVDLQDFAPQHLRAEVGIVIQQQYRHQGYALAALRALQDYARDVLRLHQLYAYADSANHASSQLFSEAGFKEKHVLHDWLLTPDGYRDACLLQCFL